MVRTALLILLALAPPAAALTLADLAGSWRGEGVWRAEGEPEQRLRCQLRGVERAQGLLLQGRCATAQGGQSFAWGLVQDRGAVTARDEGPQTDDSPPPPPVRGRIGPDGLRFDTPGGGRFDLVAGGGGLRLTLTGQDRGRTVTAEARLEPAR
jgi:hypothetical protein